MVYSTRRFVVYLSVCQSVLVFLVLLVLRLPRLGKRELILVLFVRLFDLCLFGFVCFLFSSSWGLGRAAVCDCGTPRTFLLPFFLMVLGQHEGLELPKWFHSDIQDGCITKMATMAAILKVFKSQQ